MITMKASYNHIFASYYLLCLSSYSDDTVFKKLLQLLPILICVQMAGLCWMVAVLAFFLSTENSLADVDQNRLAGIVDGILKKWVNFCITE